MKLDSRCLPLSLIAAGIVIAGCSLSRGSGTGQPYYGPGTGPVGSFIPIFNPGPGASGIGSISAGPMMNTPRLLHTATVFGKAGGYAQGGILVAGGDNGNGQQYISNEVFDAATNVWTRVNTLNPNPNGLMTNTHITPAPGNPSAREDRISPW